jgi:DNA end-binding protein Ku
MAALWRGYLRLSLVSCPVAVQPATTERGKITFNQLNAKTGHRVRQKLIDEETGAEVERTDIVKGYQIEKGQYVVVDDAEIKALEIESSKVIDLESFVDAATIDSLYLEKPYYLAPDGPIGAETFSVIAHALREKGKAALGRVVIASREHVVAIRPYDGTLVMTTLRSAGEVRAPEFRETGEGVNDEAVSLAGMIIDQRAGTFDPKAVHDRYQDALKALVEEKAKGRRPSPSKVAEPAPVIDLMAALKRSLGDAGKGAAGKQAAAGKGRKKAADTRQRSLILPLKGGKPDKAAAAPAAKPAEPKRSPTTRRRAS